MIFLPGFSTWLSLSKRPKCKRHNWPAIVIAMDGYGSTRCPSRWYHGNLVPKPTSTTKSKSKLGTKHICGAQKQNKTQELWMSVSAEEERDRDICKNVEKKLHEIGSAANGFSEATKAAGLSHWNCRPGRWTGRQAGRQLGVRSGLRLE